MNKAKVRSSLFILCVGVFFIFLCSNQKSLLQKKIIINEVCTNNFSNYSDKQGNYFNWMELYNPTNGKVSLNEYQIVRGNKKDKYVFDDVILESGQYLVVFFTEDVPQEENGDIYSGYEIDNTGEQLFILDPDSNIVDYVETPALGINEAYARISNGSEKWQIQSATPFNTNEEQAEIFHAVQEANTEKPVFSVKSGFYEEAFELTIYVDNEEESEIYYTIDGSIPTRESEKYVGPILIKDASDNPNIYSMITDTIAQGKSEVGTIIPPTQLVDKATVVRAVAYDGNGRASEIVTSTYFVGFGGKAEYDNMEVISLISDPDNFFDYDIGIYVAGRIYDGIQVTEDYLWQKANYRKRGRSAERDVHIDYFDKDHNLILSKECGIRTRGKATRAYQQKSFNLYARSEYDGSTQFEYDFWNDGGYASEITLASGGNDITTKARDYIASNLAEGLEFVSCKFRPCAVFLNGEYWGLYYITEKVNAEYIHKYYDIQEDQAVVIRNWQVEDGKKEDLAKLHEDMQYIGSANLTIPENYEKVCQLIDIESTIDYFAFQMCIGRSGDWLGRPDEGGNVGLWKSACVIPDKPYYDGKWRWIFYDANSGSMEEAEFDTISHVNEKCFYSVFPNLMTNPEFREQYIQRVDELINSVTKPEYANAVVEQVQKEIRPQVINTFERYYDGLFTEETFDYNVGVIRSFFEDRYKYLATFTNTMHK